jgi:hypothetical protein
MAYASGVAYRAGAAGKRALRETGPARYLPQEDTTFDLEAAPDAFGASDLGGLACPALLCSCTRTSPSVSVYCSCRRSADG